MLFFTAGLWFDSSTVASKRHFSNSDEMNRCVIRRWNNIVTDNDTVYILGDIGEFEYLKELNGSKIIFLSRSDMRFYDTYIKSITDKRDEMYDKEMFEVYAQNTYGADHIQYNKKSIKKIYSGRFVSITMDYANNKDKKLFNITNLGDGYRLIDFGINVDASMNFMTPVSEVEIESLIKRYL